MNNALTPRTRTAILSIVVAGIAVAAIVFPALTASGATAAPVTETVERVAEPTPSVEEQAIIDWALGLYAEAGLELPAVEIGFYDTKDACEGSKGTYRPQADGIARVRVCDWHERAMLRDAWRRKTLVHELAHAWAHLNLEDAVEIEFTEARGLDTWNDRSVAWEQRGTEHAAEVITWGLMDQRMSVDVRIDDTGCDTLTGAYEMLTGTTPVNGPTHNC